MSELALKLIEREKEERSGYLDLGRCGLTELPDLSGLEWLETLIVSNSWWDREQRKSGIPEQLGRYPPRAGAQAKRKLYSL